jgi:hypothetical protein
LGSKLNVAGFGYSAMERTSLRAGVAPAEVQRLLTAHYYDNYPTKFALAVKM